VGSWFATGEQERGGEVSWRARLTHVACLVVGVVGWVGLGVLFWGTGTAGGAVCAAVTWMAIMGFAQVYAYQSRAGYLLAAVTPAVAMLITPLAIPNRAMASVWPVWLMLALSVAFAVSSARQTMAARRRFEKTTQDLRDSEQSYRLLADNVTDVISLATADNQRLYVSPSIERVLGFAPGELLAEPNYRYMHPDDT
jgi:PAS domain-containing protein